MSKARILVEWSIGGVKSTFRVLRQRPQDEDMRPTLFETCLRMWNFRVRRTHVSEAAKVFSRGDDMVEVGHDAEDEFNVDFHEVEE